MRNILLLILIAASFTASAQTWSFITGRQRYTGGVGVPVKDSTYFSLGSDTAIIYIGTDGNLYYKYKTWHNKLSTASDLSSRTLSINGVTYNLSANRTWNIGLQSASEVDSTIDQPVRVYRVGIWNSVGNNRGYFVPDLLSSGSNQIYQYKVPAANGTMALEGWVINNNSIANVLDYGADPTGVSKSTTAIANAIASGKPVIYFPKGTYLYDSIIVTRTLKLIGAGRDSVTLKIANSSSTHERWFSVRDRDSTNDITISDITFDGNYSNQSHWDVRIIAGNWNNMNINQCNFINSSFCAIDVRQRGSAVISNCKFSQMREHGASAGQTSQAIYANPDSNWTNFVVENCRFTATTPSAEGKAPGGIFISSKGGNDRIQIRGNYFDGIGQYYTGNYCGSIYLYDLGYGSVIEGNYIINRRYTGILSGDGGNVTIQNNLVNGVASDVTSSNAAAAIIYSVGSNNNNWVHNDRTGVIMNNVIRNNVGQQGITVLSGKGISNPIQAVIIKNNVIDTTDVGIFLDGTLYGDVESNVVKFATNYSLWVRNAKGTLIANNNTFDSSNNVRYVQIFSNIDSLNITMRDNLINSVYGNTVSYKCLIRGYKSLLFDHNTCLGSEPLSIGYATPVFSNITNNITTATDVTFEVNAGLTGSNYRTYGNTWQSEKGSGTLSGGTVTISNTSVRSDSKIFVQLTNCSSCGTIYVGTVSAGTSFVVNSTNGSDGSTFNWWIVN